MRLKPVSHVDLTTSRGPMRTHLFQPNSPRKTPAIVLYSEIYQMTGPIARTAAFLAGQGYLVAVPEVYHEYAEPGEAFAYDQAGTDRGNTLKVTKSIDAYDDDSTVLVDYLTRHDACTGSVGSMGICLGGHLAFRACFHPSIRAGVCLYATDIHKRSLGAGMNDNTLVRIPDIRCPMLMIWGRQDPHIPLEGRRMIYDAMVAADLVFSWHEFTGEHAFLRDEGHRYDPALQHLVHLLVIQHFAAHL